MTMWAVTVTFGDDLSEDRLVELGDSLDATVAVELGVGFTVTLHPSVSDPLTAIHDAMRQLARAGHIDPVGIEVLSEAEYEQRALAPNAPDIVSAVEAAEILGVSRQRLHQIRVHAQFPQPLYDLRTGPLWTREAIEWFARNWDRKPGRPVLKSA